MSIRVNQINLPADITPTARTVVTWAGAPELLTQILAGCPELRRLYLVWLPGDQMPRIRDQRVKLLPLDPLQPPEMQLRQVWEAEPVFFAEARNCLYIPVELRLRAPDMAAAIEKNFMDFLRGFFSQMTFRALRGWHVLENMLLNIPWLAGSYSLESLRERSAGRPVIVVGAGPALDRNIELLQQVQAKAVIVACDGAWLPLDRAGIVPDLVVSTDAGDIVWRFWASLSSRQKNVPLVALLQTSWPAVHHHSGPVYLCRGAAPVYSAIEEHTGIKMDFMDAGQCVGHAAFDIACRLGGDPVILTAFNLAFEGEVFHPRDMAAPVYHKHPPPAANLRQVAGIDGNAVTTDLSMFIYLKEFERRFAAIRRAGAREIWDATGAGARKQGARIVDDAEVLAKCAGLSKPALATDCRPGVISVEQSAGILDNWYKSAAQLGDAISLDNPWNGYDEFADWLGRLCRDRQLMALMNTALNPRLAAELHFELESRCLNTSKGEQDVKNVKNAKDVKDVKNIGSSDRPDVVDRYLRDLSHIAGLISEIARHARPAGIPSAKLVLPGISNLRCQISAESGVEPSRSVAGAKNIMALLPAGKYPSQWPDIRNSLELVGWKIIDYKDAFDDFPAIWRQCRLVETDVIIATDSIMPAAWHLPGRICLDLREQPPDEQGEFEMAENWMRGYALVSPLAEIAGLWRATMPPDRPVYLWQASGCLTEQDSGKNCNWNDIIARLRAEI